MQVKFIKLHETDIDTVLGNMMKQTIKYPSGGLEEWGEGGYSLSSLHDTEWSRDYYGVDVRNL